MVTAGKPGTALNVTQAGTGDILNLFDGSEEVFTVLNGGSVGIGNTSPIGLLEVGRENSLFFPAGTSALEQPGINHKFDVNGNIGIVAGGYLNFASVDGDSGYGFKDNSGTIQYRNSGGAWTTFGSGLGGSSVWSDLTLPGMDLSLAMNTFKTTFNWATGTSSDDLFSLTNQCFRQRNRSSSQFTNRGFGHNHSASSASRFH